MHIEPRPPNQSRMRLVRELFEGGIYFVYLQPDNQCGNNSRAGRIQGCGGVYVCVVASSCQ